MSFIHAKADVADSTIGEGTNIWQFVVVLAGAKIGNNCNICAGSLIEGDTEIGDNVTVKSGVQIWNGTRIESGVFIGPNVTFTNDKFPRSKRYLAEDQGICIKQNASIGANATILPNVTIGKNSMIGAGAVVTKDVPENAVVVGNPAKVIRLLRKEEGAINTGQSIQQHLPETLSQLQSFHDDRGRLQVAEFGQHIPFPIKRVFWISDVQKDSIRGEHAHKECHQFIIAVSGSVTIELDNGQDTKKYKLSSGIEGLHIVPKTWGTLFGFSENAIVVVLASHNFDEADYLRSYKDFQMFLSEGNLNDRFS